MDKKTVLILTNSDAGLYHFRKEVIIRLLEKNHVILCMPNGHYVKHFEEYGCECVTISLERRGMNVIDEIKLFFNYVRILKIKKPDIVFTYTIKPNVYGGFACSILKIPYVANITGLGSSLENGGFLQLISVLLYRIGLRKAKKVYFQNTNNQEFMLNKKIVKNNYDLLPGSGVNLQEYIVIDYPNREVVEFVFIARIMKEKGIDQYLEAAKIIKDKYPNTIFHICGRCEESYSEIIEHYQKSGVVIYHGEVNNIAAMHSRCSCTIHPTYYPEGLSNVLLEACACGRPAITTNRPGCREVIEDGKNGFIIMEKNTQDLVSKIERFLSLSVETRKEMGLYGRKKVEDAFSRDIVVEKYLRELDGL